MSNHKWSKEYVFQSQFTSRGNYQELMGYLKGKKVGFLIQNENTGGIFAMSLIIKRADMMNENNLT